jgi:hypothetical protein
MHRVKKWAIPVTLVAALSVGGATQAFAAHHSSGSPSSPMASSSHSTTVAPNAVVKQRVLKVTARSQGGGIVAVPSGFQPIDGVTTLHCPGTTTCTFEADQNVQVRGSTASNDWAICTQVDGAYMTQPLCPFLGQVPNGFFGAGSFVQTQTGLSPGNHTVRTFLYTDNGADRSIYTILYRVYTP